ncbi:MAG TPA: hypothetical protein VGY54_19140 [Polyangiaceae bacterium]|jgi:uncharacterized protein involved in exopolysaccharide biosynthesis|nr:hypothetical protein [Polyangiaceae bacterium]
MLIKPNADPSDETHEQLAEAAAFLRRTLRFWTTAVLVLVLGAVACAVFLRVRNPAYRSETVILYSESARTDDDVDRPDTARSLTVRLREILMSRASLDAVMREFDLYSDIRTARGEIDAVEELKKHIEFRAPGGDTVSVAFTGTSPSQARDVTARLAEVLIQQDSDLRTKQAIAIRDFLETQRRETEHDLRDAETALASFMAAHPRFALDATPLASGAAVRATLGAGAVQAPGIGRPWRVTAPGSESASNAAAPAPGVREAAAEDAQARAALAAARANYADLAARFTAAHPDVRAAQAEVDRATNRLAAASAAFALADRSLSSTPTPVQPRVSSPAPAPKAAVAATDSRGAAGPVGTAVASASPADVSRPPPDRDVVALETEWVKLTRATTEAREHEDQVEAALFKAKSVTNSKSGGHRVQVTMIDPAFVPKSPVPPGRAMIVALFAAGSLFLAGLSAVLRALLSDRVYAERDIRPLAPVLVEIPRRLHAARG